MTSDVFVECASLCACNCLYASRSALQAYRFNAPHLPIRCAALVLRERRSPLVLLMYRSHAACVLRARSSRLACVPVACRS